jgi:hypothetical protein
VTRLSDRHDQASAKAAASKHSHDAEVQEHSAMCIHVFGAWNACIKLVSSIIMSFHSFPFNLLFIVNTFHLSKHHWLFTHRFFLHSLRVLDHDLS